MDIPAISFTSDQGISTYEELYREFLDDRILMFEGDVDDSVISNQIMYILKWNKEDKDLPVDKRKPIRMFISSGGGNVFSANMLIDVIESSKTPVWGIGLDLIASAAYIIYLACHKRISFKNSAFLQHEGDIVIENSRSKAKNCAEFFDSQEARAKEFILSHTTMTEEYYDSVYDQELWMYPQKAREYGIVHMIIGEDCDLDYVLGGSYEV